MSSLLDNRQRQRYVLIFEWIVVGTSVVSMASEAAQYLLLRQVAAGVPVSAAVADANDWRQQVVSSTQLVLILLAFVAVVLWTHRAYENLHHLTKSPRPEYSAGAAGWGWFVPILNFWYPFRVMKDLWYLTQRYAQPDDAIRYERDHSLIGGWWALRLFTFFAGRGLIEPGFNATIVQYQHYSLLSLGMDVLHIWYAVSTVYLLKKMGLFERQLAARFENNSPVPALPASSAS